MQGEAEPRAALPAALVQKGTHFDADSIDSAIPRPYGGIATTDIQEGRYVHYDHCIVRTRSFHIEERNRTIQ
jgi:hypothetical protein